MGFYKNINAESQQLFPLTNHIRKCGRVNRVCLEEGKTYIFTPEEVCQNMDALKRSRTEKMGERCDQQKENLLKTSGIITPLCTNNIKGKNCDDCVMCGGVICDIIECMGDKHYIYIDPLNPDRKYVDKEYIKSIVENNH